MDTNIQLRDYQIQGVEFLSRRNGLLVLDCGMGKTVTAIKAIDRDMQGLVLWLCRKSAVRQVIDEISMYSNNAIATYTPAEFIALGDEDLIESNMRYFVVAYYEQLQKHVGLKDYFWDWIVADEAHLLRNVKTKRYKSVLALSSRRRVGLTATPAKKEYGYFESRRVQSLSPLQMYGILHYLYPDRFNSRIQFLNRFWQPVGWDGIITNYSTYTSMLSDVVFVRDASSSGLPEVSYITIHIAPSSRERRVYNELRRQAADDIVIKIEELSDLSLITTKAVLFTRLQQLTSMPSLLGENDIEPSKIAWLDDNIEALIEHGVVIMTRFIDTAHFIADRYRIVAHTGARRDKLQEGKTMAIVGTAAAMGESMNFWWTQNLVLYDQIWAGMHRQQAVSRIRRLKGAERNKIVFELIMDNTIDKYIHNYSINSAIPLNELKKLLHHIKDKEI